jgi:uncharacterized membrane protein YgdD (TMEM256/DUF423 family)
VNSARTLAAAGVLLALATACGAFGAHALKTQLAPERLQLWETAVRYQFFQALGLLGIGLTLRVIPAPALRAAAALIVAGVVLFCGSLYALSFGAPAAARRADAARRTCLDRRLAVVCVRRLAPLNSSDRSHTTCRVGLPRSR